MIQKFNRAFAFKITNAVGSMWCAYLFAAISLVSLPGVLATHDVVAIVQWLAQTFLQLVLLSVILVGGNLSAESTTATIMDTHEEVTTLLAEMGDMVRTIHQNTGGNDEEEGSVV